MSGRGIIIGALAVIILFLLLQAALAPDYSTRNPDLFNDMAYSPAYASLTLSPDLPGGLTQQPLREGVVIEGDSWFDYGDGAEEAARAGRELENPFAPDDVAAAARGAALFGIMCTPCHGGDGEGQGPAVLRGMVPPPSFQAARARTLPDGTLFQILTRGQGNMASYAAQVAPEDRWRIILHIRSMQREQPR
jgi:mono/diheme cytochrome c family protein